MMYTFVLSGAARTCSFCGAVEGHGFKIVSCHLQHRPSTTFLGEHSSLRSHRPDALSGGRRIKLVSSATADQLNVNAAVQLRQNKCDSV